MYVYFPGSFLSGKTTLRDEIQKKSATTWLTIFSIQSNLSVVLHKILATVSKLNKFGNVYEFIEKLTKTYFHPRKHLILQF